MIKTIAKDLALVQNQGCTKIHKEKLQDSSSWGFSWCKTMSQVVSKY